MTIRQITSIFEQQAKVIIQTDEDYTVEKGVDFVEVIGPNVTVSYLPDPVLPGTTSTIIANAGDVNVALGLAPPIVVPDKTQLQVVSGTGGDMVPASAFPIGDVVTIRQFMNAYRSTTQTVNPGFNVVFDQVPIAPSGGGFT